MTKIGTGSFINNFDTEKKVVNNKNMFDLTQTQDTNIVPSLLNKSSFFTSSTTSGKAMPNIFINESSKPEFVEYTVRKGDSLSSIAKEFLGSSNKYNDIFEINKSSMRNPNDLRIGMTLKIPNDGKTHNINNSDLDIKLPDNQQYKEVTVKRGQSLSELALKYLGNSDKYMTIFSANKDVLSSPDNVKPGMKLRIPVEATTTNTTNNTNRPKPKTDVSPVIDVPDIDSSTMTNGAKELYNALNKYQAHYKSLGYNNRAMTTEAQKKEIAVELDKAGKAFGVDPKIMLSVYAHESAGFNPRAKSHTGAGGLGQLTGIAIRQVHYMAGMAKGQRGEAPYTAHKENFITSTSNINQRYDIKKNIWTSTAYMAYEIKDRNNGNIKRALERYGDPNVSTYENKVNSEYKILFGGSVFK